MVRLTCNLCQLVKQIKKSNYEQMLSRFSIKRGFTLATFHGIESMFNKKLSMEHELSKEKMEETFINCYVCNTCKNNKKETLKITDNISRLLNIEGGAGVAVPDDIKRNKFHQA